MYWRSLIISVIMVLLGVLGGNLLMEDYWLIHVSYDDMAYPTKTLPKFISWDDLASAKDFF